MCFQVTKSSLALPLGSADDSEYPWPLFIPPRDLYLSIPAREASFVFLQSPYKLFHFLKDISWVQQDGAKLLNNLSLSREGFPDSKCQEEPVGPGMPTLFTEGGTIRITKD